MKLLSCVAPNQQTERSTESQMRFKNALQHLNRAAHYLQVMIHLFSYSSYCANLSYVDFKYSFHPQICISVKKVKSSPSPVSDKI